MSKATMEQYDAYKDSGVEWIGEVPEHWGLKRLVDVSFVIDPQPDHRAPAIAEIGGYPYIGIRDLNEDGSLNFETARKVELSAVEKQECSFKVMSGDILFCKVGTLGEPRIVIPKGRFALSATLVLIKLKNKESNVFLRYALDSSCVFDQINHFGSGSTRPALGIKQIRKFCFPFPSLPEQKAIADYIDTKTAQIDRKIDLLTQKATKYGKLKQSLINETVTRGLDKSVAMKDSGVEWIGEVPEHWCSYRIHDCTVPQKNKNVGLQNKNLLSLSYGKIKKKDFDTSFGLLPASFETYQIVNNGNIILRLTDLQNDKKVFELG